MTPSETDHAAHAAQPQCPWFDPTAGPQHSDLYAMYARSRHEQPVFFYPALNAWIVTRYADVRAILLDQEHFSMANVRSLEANRFPVVNEILAGGVYDYVKTAHIMTDDPDHSRLRGSVIQYVHPRRVPDLEPQVHEIATEIIDSFGDRRQIDFVKEFAYPFPLSVILLLFGVPMPDMELLMRLSEDYARFCTTALPEEEAARSAESIVALQHYLKALIEDRHLNPREDYLSDLLRAVDGGVRTLSLPELIQIMFSFITAGHQTTLGALANGLYQLLLRPERWQAIVDNPARIPATVEELLRFDAPLAGNFRTVRQAVEVGGVRLQVGDRVAFLTSSADHDETVFPDPEDFDPERANIRDHLAFGHGTHFCLGASLARREMKVALEVLTARMPGLRLAGGPELEYIPNILLRHPRCLNVEW